MEDVAPTAIRTDDGLNNNENNNEINNNNNNADNQNRDNPFQFIKTKDFNYSYQNKSFIISIKLSSDKKYIYIKINENNNLIYYFEIKMTYDELKIFDKIFKICDNLEEAYETMIVIFNYEKNSIKEITGNKLVLSIFILSLDKTYREKNLELIKKFQNKENLIDNLIMQIGELKETNQNLEKEIKQIKSENAKIKENFINFKKEITKDVNELKNKITSLEKNSPSMHSKIIKKNDEFDFVIERLKRVNLNENQNENQNNEIKYFENIEFLLLYRASKDGDRSKIFHEKCDKVKNTLTIVKTKKGLRFGGFTSQTWDGDGDDKKDINAFCFSLDRKKIYNSIKGKNAIYADPGYGPAFENCIFEIKDQCFTHGGFCSDESDKYFDNHENKCEINNGEDQFEVEDVEVFNVLFE